MATGLTGVIRCGVTHPDSRCEAITRHMREEQGFRTDGGCGLAVDLANDIALALLYRCVECGRWLCRACIEAHFAETTPPTEARARTASE